jgi:membrane protease YdiL (CAAX protease family)
MLYGDIWPLHKMISKITQILLLLSIFPLRRYLNLSWSELGFAAKKVFFSQIAIGLGLGILTLLPMLLVLYGLEVHLFDNSRLWTFGMVLKRTSISLLLAILISIVEESLFRGLLLTSLRQKINVIIAVLLSSFYYGSLHFLETNTRIAYQEITFSSGFVLLNEAIANWLNPQILSAFIALFMVGVFLSVVRVQIKHSLGLCIGFHASWVWQIKLSKDFFNTNAHSPYLYLVSNYDGLVGPLIAGWLFLAIAAYLAYQRWLQKASKTLPVD